MLKVLTKNERGFTLIELLVVIAIIGLLASIVLVSLGPVRSKARDAQRQSDMRQINLAMEMCYDDGACNASEVYPDTTAGGNTLTQIDTDGTPLLLTVPIDPRDASPNQYTWTNGSTSYYCVYTKLEAQADTWFCGSNKGVLKKTQATYTPSNSDCCGVDITN